ncbi:MAG TPA: hypothetical protein VFM28_11315 [Nitrososphaeraceae archaeon]|nr:hypothetical protein [Nitrososphaeraceae archaeon]
MNNDASYDKIKHLVEIEDDIFAVFTINSKGEVTDLNIAKNIDIEKRLVEDISTNFKDILKEENEKIIINSSEILGKLKWKIFEYEKIRLLCISEMNKTVVVLIKSNTSLDETVDNILGYYYEEEDDIPKSLF